MKAAVYYETGAPEVLRYEDVPDPVASPGSVLIEIGAISVEGGDTLNRAGGEMATNPHIVGYQCAGTIIEVGEGVTDRFVGQRVVATGLWGSHAAMIAAPSVITWVIPEGADLVKCACVPVAFGTAARLPVRVRSPEVGRDGADPGRRGRRRRRRDPTRQARRARP